MFSRSTFLEGKGIHTRVDIHYFFFFCVFFFSTSFRTMRSRTSVSISSWLITWNATLLENNSAYEIAHFSSKRNSRKCYNIRNYPWGSFFAFFICNTRQFLNGLSFCTGIWYDCMLLFEFVLFWFYSYSIKYMNVALNVRNLPFFRENVKVLSSP